MRKAFILSLAFLLVILAVSCGQKQTDEATAEKADTTAVDEIYIPEFAYTSYDELLTAAKDGNKNVIIDFYTDW